MIYYKSLTREVQKNCGYYSLVLFDFNPTLLSLELSNLFRFKPDKNRDNFYLENNPRSKYIFAIIDLIEMNENIFIINLISTGFYSVEKYLLELIEKVLAKEYVSFNFRKLSLSCKSNEDFRYKDRLSSLLGSSSYVELTKDNNLYISFSNYHSKLFSMDQVIYKRERIEGTMKTKFLIKEIEKVCK